MDVSRRDPQPTFNPGRRRQRRGSGQSARWPDKAPKPAFFSPRLRGPFAGSWDGRLSNYGGSLSFYEGLGALPKTRWLSSRAGNHGARRIGGVTHEGMARLRTVLQPSIGSSVAAGGSGLSESFAIPLNGLSAL